MLAILLSLGVWQLERRAWKHNLLAQIDAAEARPAIPMPPNPAPFTKVRVEGRLRADLTAIYGAEVRGTTLGGQLIMPMERTGQAPLLIDLGWVPNEADAAHPFKIPQGPIDGFIRPPEHASTFSGKDSPDKRLFYTLDPALIGKSLGLPNVAPYTLIAIGTPQPGVYPDPATALPRPADNHLQYAFTWFGFALTLAIIFALYARKAPRA